MKSCLRTMWIESGYLKFGTEKHTLGFKGTFRMRNIVNIEAKICATLKVWGFFSFFFSTIIP